jgi:hypothetical protein
MTISEANNLHQLTLIIACVATGNINAGINITDLGCHLSTRLGKKQRSCWLYAFISQESKAI